MKRSQTSKHKPGLWSKLLAIIQAHLLYLRYSKEQLVVLLATLLTLSGAIDLLADCGNCKFYLFLAISVLAILLYLIYYLFIRYRNDAENVMVLENYNRNVREKLKCSTRERTDGYNVKCFTSNAKREYYVESDLVNAALRDKNCEIPIYYNRNKFKIPEEVIAYVPAILRWITQEDKTFFNGQLLRQASHLGFPEDDKDKFAPVLVQKTDYFSGQCTHEIVYHSFTNSRSIQSRFDGCQLLMRKGCELINLCESHSANFIGVSALAVTKDNHLIIVMQDEHAMVNSNRYVPSGSGSVSYRDYTSMRKQCGKDLTLNDVLIHAMERELYAEFGLSPRSAIVDKTQLVGFARLLERGGKPDFFGILWLNRTMEQFKNLAGNFSRKLDLPVNPDNIENDIGKTLERFCERHKEDGKISIQLYLLAHMTEGVYICV